MRSWTGQWQIGTERKGVRRFQRWNQQDLGAKTKRIKDNTKFEGLSERMWVPLAEAAAKLIC